MKYLLGLICFLSFSVSAQNAVTVLPTVNSGLKVARNIDTNTTDTAVKAAPGNIYGYYLFNAAATTRYFKFYNATTANVTVGTTTPVITIPVPAGAGANVEFTNAISFDTAITIACTTGLADNNSGAPTANDCISNIFYK